MQIVAAAELALNLEVGVHLGKDTYGEVEVEVCLVREVCVVCVWMEMGSLGSGMGMGRNRYRFRSSGQAESL